MTSLHSPGSRPEPSLGADWRTLSDFSVEERAAYARTAVGFALLALRDVLALPLGDHRFAAKEMSRLVELARKTGDADAEEARGARRAEHAAELLQVRRAARAVSGGARGGGMLKCPTPEELWDAIECAGSAEGRRKVVDHLSDCSPCREDWQMARELGARPPSVGRTLGRLLDRMRPPWRSL